MDRALELCKMLDAALVEREKTDHAVSVLAGGAAFELWLAFEARILVESPQGRKRLGLEGEAKDPSFPERFWTGNEVEKFDLYVGDCDDPEDCALAVEFKLVHNNKNWQSKVDEVWADLFREPGSAKHRHRSKVRGIVALVGKTYATHTEEYPGQRSDLAAWEKEVWAWAEASYEGARMERRWSGTRIKLDRNASRWLDGSHEDHWFQLHLVCDAAVPPEAAGAVG